MTIAKPMVHTFLVNAIALSIESNENTRFIIMIQNTAAAALRGLELSESCP